jgi:multiple sugar transport system substrate-binding protein
MVPLFYNIEVLQNAGFNRPPRNRSEFLELSRTLAGQGRHGIALSLSPANPRGLYRDILPWFWAAGAPGFPDGGPLFPGRAAAETLEFLDSLRRDGLLSPGSFSKTAEQKREEFIGGRIGMMTGAVSDIALLRQRMPPGEDGRDRFGITALPVPDGFVGKPAFGLLGWYAAVPAGTKHPREARAFLRFLAEKAPLLAAAAHAVPGSGAGPGGQISGDPLFSKAWDMYEGGDAIRGYDGFRRFRELEALFRVELFSLFEGSRSPAETAEALRRGWADISNGEVPVKMEN